MNNQVPWLRSGKGLTPADGGCIMQIVDWLDNTSWSDRPECVHPVIRELAIRVNDVAEEDKRQKLLDLTSRLMGTNTGDEKLTRKLLGYLARQVYPLFERWAHETGCDDYGSVLACVEAAERGMAADAADAAEAAKAAWAAEAAWAVDAADAAWSARAARAADAAWTAKAAWASNAADAAEAAQAASYDLLVGLLDRYDELTGRTKVESVDVSPVCAILGREYVR